MTSLSAKEGRVLMKSRVVQDDWGNDDWLPEQWMSLSEAVDAAVSAMGLSYIDAKANILELIADAKLPLRCQKVQEGDDIGCISWGIQTKTRSFRGQLGRSYKFRSRSPEEPLTLKTDFFSTRRGWSLDQSRVDWAEGLILATRPTELEQSSLTSRSHQTRRVAVGVMVQRIPPLVKSAPQAAAKLPKKAALAVQPKKKRRRGATIPLETMPGEHALMEELLSKVRDGSITQFGDLQVRGTQARLGRFILLRLTQPGGEEPSLSTVQRRARRIIEAWRAKELDVRSS